MKIYLKTPTIAQEITVTHADKVRAELESARRGWARGDAAPVASLTLAAHKRVLADGLDAPKNFDDFLEEIEEFDLRGGDAPHPTQQDQSPARE